MTALFFLNSMLFRRLGTKILKGAIHGEPKMEKSSKKTKENFKK